MSITRSKARTAVSGDKFTNPKPPQIEVSDENNSRDVVPVSLSEKEVQRLADVERIHKEHPEPADFEIDHYLLYGPSEPEYVKRAPEGTVTPIALDPNRRLHLYSRIVAESVNPKQHDVNAATVLHNLALWQKMSAKGKYHQTLIEGRRYAFRSLSELRKDMPYLSESGIHKAIKRLEKAFGDEFLVRRDKHQLWFTMSERLLSLHDKDHPLNKKSPLRHIRPEDSKPLMSFHVQDAVNTGSIRSAVILGNLKFMLSKFTNPVRDDTGNRYMPLSPSKLSPVLHFSEDTISRALKEMRKSGHLVQHPDQASFYALGDGFVSPLSPTKSAQSSPAEVSTPTAEVSDRTADVSSRPAEVNRNEGTGSNQGVNEGVNEGVKDYSVLSPSASPARENCCSNISSSEGLNMLMDLAQKKVQESKTLHVKTAHLKRVPSSLLLDDHIVTNLDLPYDYLKFVEPAKTTVHAEVTFITRWWRSKGFTVDKHDIRTLHRLFADNLRVTADDLLKLFDPRQGFVELDKPAKYRKGEFRQDYFQSKIKSPKAFLKYLPQIVALHYQIVSWDDGEMRCEGDIDEPFASFNYSYLGKNPNSRIVKFDDLEPPVEYREEWQPENNQF